MTPTGAPSVAKTITEPVPADLAKMHAQFGPVGILQRRVRRNVLAAIWPIVLFASASGKRLSDILLALIILLLFSPIFIGVSVALALCGGPIFEPEPRVGRWGAPFGLLKFHSQRRLTGVLRTLRLDRLPVFVNILRGDMSIVGPTALRPEALDIRERTARKRSSVRPGLLSLWWLRKKANIHFGSERDVDLEYVDRQTVSGDFGIALRAIPSILYGCSSASAPPVVDVLGIQVDNLTMEEALQYIIDTASGEAPRQLCFVNTDCINKSVRDHEYKALLEQSDLTLADGIGIRLAGKITRSEIRQNVNGTDLFPLLCQRLQGSQLGLFLLGARPEVVEAFAEWVKRTYPRLSVKGYRDGFFDSVQEEMVLREVRDSGADVLLVAFGSPLQDLWIHKHLHELGRVRIAMGVGGLFDFYSGQIPRAPQWMRELSLEWVYRLYQEPGRMWQRYLVGNFVFLWRVTISALFGRCDRKSSVQVRGGNK